MGTAPQLKRPKLKAMKVYTRPRGSHWLYIHDPWPYGASSADKQNTNAVVGWVCRAISDLCRVDTLPNEIKVFHRSQHSYLVIQITNTQLVSLDPVLGTHIPSEFLTSAYAPSNTSQTSTWYEYDYEACNDPNKTQWTGSVPSFSELPVDFPIKWSQARRGADPYPSPSPALPAHKKRQFAKTLPLHLIQQQQLTLPPSKTDRGIADAGPLGHRSPPPEPVSEFAFTPYQLPPNFPTLPSNESIPVKKLDPYEEEDLAQASLHPHPAPQSPSRHGDPKSPVKEEYVEHRLGQLFGVMAERRLEVKLEAVSEPMDALQSMFTEMERRNAALESERRKSDDDEPVPCREAVQLNRPTIKSEPIELELHTIPVKSEPTEHNIPSSRPRNRMFDAFDGYSPTSVRSEDQHEEAPRVKAEVTDDSVSSYNHLLKQGKQYESPLADRAAPEILHQYHRREHRSLGQGERGYHASPPPGARGRHEGNKNTTSFEKIRTRFMAKLTGAIDLKAVQKGQPNGHALVLRGSTAEARTAFRPDTTPIKHERSTDWLGERSAAFIFCLRSALLRTFFTEREE
ncbi:unnamed protein product [Mycena citricolor]|uniref:Uncharacterized protein n=1 Tax=Mycena citricolor TaxID=2018698 RepID=A0AAD2HVJ1_9AGAR|nr:unnamed protein product [Mycena citricolor]